MKYGCPLVSDEEIAVAAEAISRESNGAVQGQGARNLAYRALVAIRLAHFQECDEAALILGAHGCRPANI